MADVVQLLNAALAGRYAVEGPLGEGGMATVYLATDLRHQRKVALKVLKPELAAAVGAQRFLFEIRTTANLRHPHILPLFDSGEADSFLYYVMPYVEGESLRARLTRERQLPVNDSVRLAIEVAEALDHAHRNGVIHRDIKPENVLLQDGKAIVADFGIAVAVQAASGERLTRTGVSVGTPHYMSPEQATGDAGLGAATDVYSLACVLYEMLVGEPPFTGRSPQAILGRIVSETPDLVTRHRRSVPPNVESALHQALEKLPADRFATAQDFAKALADPAFRHHAFTPDARTPARWRRLAVAGWAVAALGLAIGAWGMLQAGPAPASVTRHVLGTDGLAVAEAPFGHLAAIAPDGSSAVLPLGSFPSSYQLGLKLRGSTDLVPIPGTEGAQEVVYSPDAEWIAYRRIGDLFKRRLSDGTEVRLAEDIDDGPAAIAWLDDGTILYEQRISTLDAAPSVFTRIPGEGGEPVQVIETSAEIAPFPIWVYGLPGSRGALVVSCTQSFTCTAKGTDLYALDLETASYELIEPSVVRAWYVPNTRQVVFVRPDGAVLAMRFDAARLEPMGGPVPVLDGVRVGGSQADMVMGDDGTVLYVQGEASAFGLNDIVWVDRSGNETPLDPNLAAHGYTTLDLSPNERLLALSLESILFSGIWVKELPDGPLTRLSEHSRVTRWPFWGPDSSAVSYFNNDLGNAAVRRVRADGGSGDSVETVLLRERSVMDAVYTPDGRGLIFQEVFPEQKLALGFFDLATGQVTQEPRDTGLNERALALSPDGRWLAFSSAVSGRSEVYVRPALGTSARVQVSTNGGRHPQWAHDGRELFYIEHPTRSLMAASVSTDLGFSVRSRERLFDVSRYEWASNQKTYDVSRDERFVFLKPTAGDARLVLIENWLQELRGQRPR